MLQVHDGQVIYRRGFLEPLDDPDLPYRFFYR